MEVEACCSTGIFSKGLPMLDVGHERVFGGRGGGVVVCNFAQFLAISHNFSAPFSDLPMLCACWCPLLSMVNEASVHNYLDKQSVHPK